MRSWLAQFKISEALRRGTGLSPFWRREVDNNPVLAAQERSARRLDRRLRQEARTFHTRAPEDLAPAILKAVRRSAWEPMPTVAGGGLRWWTPATAVALAACCVVWWLAQPAPDPVSEASGSVSVATQIVETRAYEVFSTGGLLAGMGLSPVGVMSDPLADQLDAASEDARAAARFLVASLP